MPELAVESVTVRFGGLQALDDVSLQVAHGAVTGLIGPNGAGKTTLFDVVTGLRRPQGGRVLLGGDDVTSLAPHQRARRGIARTFQRLELFGTLSALENVQLAAEARRRHGATAVAEELLGRVGLAGREGEPADLLPTGQARLLELARALATAPSVLLLDEPSAGLDEAESKALGGVLAGLAAEGLAVLLVEHDVSLVMELCHHVVVLDAGLVIARGTPEAVRADPVVQHAYLGAPADAMGAPGGPATPAPTPGTPARPGRPGGPAGPAPGGGVPALELGGVRAG
ncbi:MAG: ABC transporter ATP-binding protein, partial [Acidobacteriota bacterium]|nr:ABC transporter ATP-binding protein [Acidobacteriota bacterium]